MLVSNLMFDEILMYKKVRKMQHSQTEKGVEQENENHMSNDMYGKYIKHKTKKG